MDIQTVNDLIEAIEDHGSDAVIKAGKKTPIPSTALRELYKNFPTDEDFLYFLASYPLIPSDLADEIASKLTKRQNRIATALSGNPRSSQQTLNKLAAKGGDEVKLALANNPNLTPREFQELVQSDDRFTRSTLASNPSLPSHLQFILATDKDTGVKLALAARPNLDLDVAIRLSTDPSPLVRAAVVCCADVEKELYQFWADQDDETNQLLILRRPEAASQKNIVSSIRNSTHRAARHAAFDAAPIEPYEMLALAESDDTEDRVYLASKAQIPVALQRILAQDTSPKVRRRLAASENLESEIAAHIAASSDLEACTTLAKNPATDAETLSALCSHPEDSVATLIAYREDLTDEHWDILVNHRSSDAVAKHISFQGIHYPNTEEGAADKFAHSDNPSLRALSAHSIHQEASNLSTLSKDVCQKVREAVVANPNTTDAALERLCFDPIFEIAETAEKTLSTRRISDPDTTRTAKPLAFDPSADRDKFFTKIKSFFNQ